MSQTDLEYLLVGSVTKDLLPDDSHVIGGTITYAATVIKYLGGRPTIITAASSDFIPPAYLADLDWRILPSPETTTFRNEYTPQGRRQTIGPIARSIRPIDIPTDCQHPTLVHLCPLAQDVEPGVTAVFNNSSLRAATPQGWLRQWDEEGLVSLGNWEKLEKIFSTLQIAVVSIEDIEGNWRIAERWAAHIPILIVTQDKHGCTLFEQGQPKPVPPRPAQPLNPTGAGDVFAAAFFIRFQETGHPWHSARFANVVASMAIERQGPGGVPNRHEVETYLAQHPAQPT